MTDVPPGAAWFPDPSVPGQLRYWDGTRWTEHVHRDESQHPAASSVAPAGHPVATAGQPVATAGQPVATAGQPVEPAGPPKTRRTGLVVTLVSVGVVVVLALVTAVAWGPVSSVLFPKYALADTEFYDQAAANLREAFDGHAEDPLSFPGAVRVDRQPVAYVGDAEQYIEEFIAEYAAEDRIFGSEDEADEYAYSVTTPLFSGVEDKLKRGGVDLPPAQKSHPQAPELVAIEEQIRAMPIAPGADGTYRETAQSMASLLGVELTTDVSMNDCLGLGGGAAASFCPSETNWGRVFLYPRAVDAVDRPDFVDLIKHELSHKLIFAQCLGSYGDDLRGAAWSVQYGEGVTNSYAVLFLGADPARLVQEADYAMNDVTYAKAQAIHDGDLGCFDDNVAPPLE